MARRTGLLVAAGLGALAFLYRRKARAEQAPGLGGEFSLSPTGGPSGRAPRGQAAPRSVLDPDGNDLGPDAVLAFDWVVQNPSHQDWDLGVLLHVSTWGVTLSGSRSGDVIAQFGLLVPAGGEASGRLRRTILETDPEGVISAAVDLLATAPSPDEVLQTVVSGLIGRVEAPLQPTLSGSFFIFS